MPERTCVACRAKRPQAELLRVTLDAQGSLRLGPGPGRGAYLCPGSPGCVTTLLRKRPLGRALRTEVSSAALEELAALVTQLAQPAPDPAAS